MHNRSEEVDQYLRDLDHPLKEAVAEIRALILTSDEEITEHVKWNAPSFCFGGEDRVTFRLHPKNRLQLVFHRGAKVRDNAGEFAFEDRSGLVEWVAEDRGVVTFTDLADVEVRKATLVALVKQWVRT